MRTCIGGRDGQGFQSHPKVVTIRTLQMCVQIMTGRGIIALVCICDTQAPLAELGILRDGHPILTAGWQSAAAGGLMQERTGVDKKVQGMTNQQVAHTVITNMDMSTTCTNLTPEDIRTGAATVQDQVKRFARSKANQTWSLQPSAPFNRIGIILTNYCAAMEQHVTIPV
jgi:hypothetical protein